MLIESEQDIELLTDDELRHMAEQIVVTYFQGLKYRLGDDRSHILMDIVKSRLVDVFVMKNGVIGIKKKLSEKLLPYIEKCINGYIDKFNEKADDGTEKAKKWLETFDATDQMKSMYEGLLKGSYEHMIENTNMETVDPEDVTDE